MFEAEVSVPFTFSHTLEGFGDKYSSPHEHTWDVTLILSTKDLDMRGVSIDFQELKTKLRALLEQYEGKFLNETDLPVASQPTAEHLALWVAAEMDKHYPGLLSSVAVGSPDSRARFLVPRGSIERP